MEQRLRHDPGARAQFNNNPGTLQRQWPQHGPSEVTRTGSDRANGLKVGQSLHGKRCQICLRKALLIELTEILCRAAWKCTTPPVLWKADFSQGRGLRGCRLLDEHRRSGFLRSHQDPLFEFPGSGYRLWLLVRRN
jgi:hypothetical protein